MQDIHTLILDALLTPLDPSRIQEAASVLDINLKGHKYEDGGIFFANGRDDAPDVPLIQWITEQKKFGAKRIFLTPWVEGENKIKAVYHDSLGPKDFHTISGYNLAVAYEKDFAYYFQHDDHKTEDKKFRSIRYVFQSRTTNRPCVSPQAPEYVAADYRQMLKEFFLKAEAGGKLRWVNNIRRRLAKLRIEPKPRSDLTEAMLLLNRHHGAIQILDALDSDYIFEGFHEHGIMGLETPEKKYSAHEIQDLIYQIDEYENYAMFVALGARQKGKD